MPQNRVGRLIARGRSIEVKPSDLSTPLLLFDNRRVSQMLGYIPTDMATPPTIILKLMHCRSELTPAHFNKSPVHMAGLISALRHYDLRGACVFDR